MMSILDSLSLGPCFAAHGISEIYPEEDESSPEYDSPKPLQTGPWASIEDKYLMQILSYVNYPDLLECRLVCNHYNLIISQSQQFIGSTVFITSFKPGNVTDPSLLENSIIPVQNLRFQCLDHEVYIRNWTEDYATENLNFPSNNLKKLLLSHVKSIEFQKCYITWETMKRVVNETPILLEQLSLTRCRFADKKTISRPLGEFEEFSVGRTFSNLKSFKINEYHSLKTVNSLLKKLNGYSSHNLKNLFVTFDPSTEKDENNDDSGFVEQDDMESFCELARTIIEVNVDKLQEHEMNLKYQPLLNIFIPNVFGKMDRKLWKKLKLQEFSLSPPGCTPQSPILTQSTASNKNIEITVNTAASAQILIDFLETQTALKKVALPHFRHMQKSKMKNQEQTYKWKLGRSLTPGIEYLCVPNQEYLPKDFLSRYGSLKKLFIGGSLTGDLNQKPIALYSELFVDHGRNPVYLHPSGVPAHVDHLSGTGSAIMKSIDDGIILDKFRELGIGSTIINGTELMRSIKKFHFLTKFEVTSQFPVMQDEDLQAVIEGMPLLQFLNVTACDFLTDFGVTGILRNSCAMMVRLQNYHEMEDDSVLQSKASQGKPMSKLRGLKNLILMGKSNITDVGIHFGLRFPELQTACLPYNQNVTEWGVIQFGDHNPSLQTFVMCSVNRRSKEGFLHLKNAHDRIRKCIYLSYTDGTTFSNDDQSTKLDILRDAASSSMGGFCSSFTFPWFTSTSGHTYTDETQTQDNDEADNENGGNVVKNDDNGFVPIPTMSLIIPSSQQEEPKKAEVKVAEPVKEKIIVKKKSVEKTHHIPMLHPSPLPSTNSHAVKKPIKPKSKPLPKAEPEKKSVVWKLHIDKEEDAKDNNAE